MHSKLCMHNSFFKHTKNVRKHNLLRINQNLAAMVNINKKRNFAQFRISCIFKLAFIMFAYKCVQNT